MIGILLTLVFRGIRGFVCGVVPAGVIAGRRLALTPW